MSKVALPTLDGVTMVPEERVLHFGIYGQESVVQDVGMILTTGLPISGPVIVARCDDTDATTYVAQCLGCDEESRATYWPRSQKLKLWAWAHRCPGRS